MWAKHGLTGELEHEDRAILFVIGDESPFCRKSPEIREHVVMLGRRTWVNCLSEGGALRAEMKELLRAELTLRAKTVQVQLRPPPSG